MNERDFLKIKLSERDAREIEGIYDGLIGRLKGLPGTTDVEILTKKLSEAINFIADIMSSKGGSLLLYTSKIFDEDYAFAHSLNVCVISMRIGLRLGFEKKRLDDLGFLALIHAAKDIGFPEGLSKAIEDDKESDEIIRLADVYDALTHPPNYRHMTTACDTLTSIIGRDKFFDRRLIKILLEEVSFYPKGSWVELCTNEIGRVVETNKECPLRPTVEIFIDGKGNYLEETRIEDLSTSCANHVLRALTEKEVPLL